MSEANPKKNRSFPLIPGYEQRRRRSMQTGEIKMRFGRCPYCRAMIYQSPKAVIFYCSKCRTPIRGKDPLPEPRDEAEYALSRLEILSADTASVFSDELDASSIALASAVDASLSSCSTSCSNFNAGSEETTPSSSNFSSARAGSDAQEDEVWSSPNRRVDELRPSSRRTRRPSSSSDSTDPAEGSYTAGNESGQQPPGRARRSPPPSSQAAAPSTAAAAASLRALTDPAFHSELLHALDNLRNLVAVIELQPRPAGSAKAVTRRDSRLLRRLESQLTQALPAVDAEEHAPRRNATAGPPCSSVSTSSGHDERRAMTARRQRRCRPVLEGAPFVACDSCSELLRMPAKVPPSRWRGRGTRLRCGGCQDVLELTLPAAGGAARAHRSSRARSGPAASGSGGLSGPGSGELNLPFLKNRRY